MLRRNINVSSGLCNGAIGTVKVIDKNQMGFITLLKILFDGHDEFTDIERFNAQYEFKKSVYCKREQFPICLAWAITIHKSQGLTILLILIDLGKSIFEAGMAYVGLSRATELKNIHIIKLDPTVLYCNNRAVNEYNRLRRKYLNKDSLCDNPNTLPDKYKNAVFNNVKNKILKKSVINIITEDSIQPPVEEESEPAKKRKRKEQYHQENILKLRNSGTNSCYANSCVQSLISASKYLIPQV
jgi:peptide methionine sulfoxide reductase MsrA